MRLEKYDNAIADLTIAINLNSKDANAFNALGVTYSNTDQLDRSIDAFTHSIALEPNRSLSYYNRATVYVRMNDIARAIADFRKVLDINDDSSLRKRAEQQLQQLGALSLTPTALSTQVPTPSPTATSTPLPTETASPTTTSTPSPLPKKLRFMLLNYNDTPGCISVQIQGVSTPGWSFKVDGIGLEGRFSTGGYAGLCGLEPDQSVTFSVFNGKGGLVPGGQGIPSKGGAIMQAVWR